MKMSLKIKRALDKKWKISISNGMMIPSASFDYLYKLTEDLWEEDV